MPAIAETDISAPELHSPPSGNGNPRATGSLASLPQIAAVIALYSASALWFIRKFKIVDLDIWWHLATGRWILQHHGVPVTDPFSTYGMDKPWLAYSWLFDIVVQFLYQAFGYAGIVVYEIVVRVALAIVLFHLVRSLMPRFWRAAAITGIALYAGSYAIGPRPGMLTMLLSIVELDILLSARRTGNTKRLWLLPPMLCLGANWHIQFVYGLLLVGVFTAEPILNRIARTDRHGENQLGAKQFAVTLAACFLATLVNPYGIKLYSTVFQYMHQPNVFNLVVELRAMSFREPQHFAVVLLALAAAMAIGWRRDPRLLWPMLLACAAVLALRSVKEIWFLAAISAGALADGWFPVGIEARRGFLSRGQLLAAVGVLAVLVVGYRHYDVSNAWLEMQVNGNFPEAAAQYIERNHLTGPLYNDFNDGGFLIWRLPWLRVAIDGRTNVHGDERVAHSSAVWGGKPGWASDPELLSANIIVARSDTTFAALLRLDQRFKIVFENSQAVVFQPRS